MKLILVTTHLLLYLYYLIECCFLSAQIELIGQSMFDFIHMSDRATVRGVLDKATPKHKDTEFDFFVRLKCTLTSKGKNINLKSATFKVSAALLYFGCISLFAAQIAQIAQLMLVK